VVAHICNPNTQETEQEDQDFEASQTLVAHGCNPNYSGNRDQEDHGLKQAQENSSRYLNSKIPNING
jgi:hypothetical protein